MTVEFDLLLLVIEGVAREDVTQLGKQADLLLELLLELLLLVMLLFDTTHLTSNAAERLLLLGPILLQCIKLLDDVKVAEVGRRVLLTDLDAHGTRHWLKFTTDEDVTDTLAIEEDTVPITMFSRFFTVHDER